MSTQTQSPDDAYDLLMENVYVPAFFNKLASLGVPVDRMTEDDAVIALRTAAKLHNAETHVAVVKQAAAGSLFAQVEANVDGLLKQAGILADREFDNAVQTISADPTIANAVLQLQEAAARRALEAQPKAS